MKSKSKSYIMLILSMVISGSVGVVRTFIPLPSSFIAFLRGLFGSIALLLFFVLTKRKFEKLPLKTIILLIINGACLGYNWVFLFEAFNFTTVSKGTLCYYIEPTIVLLVSPLIFKEKITLKKIICAVVSIVGMVFVSGLVNGGGVGSKDFLGVIFALIAAVLYSTVVILNKKIEVEDSYQKTIIQLFSSAITILPYVLLTEDVGTFDFSGSTILLLVVICIIHTSLVYALFFGSMDNLSSQSISTITYVDPVMAMIFSAVILNEKLGLFGIIGAVLIIGASLLSEYDLKDKNYETKISEINKK